jgi:hypothetical protein
MVLPIDAADWEFVLTLAALRVDATREFQAGNRELSNAKSEEFRQTAARVGGMFKNHRGPGMVKTAEAWATRFLAGEDVPRLTKYFAERSEKLFAAQVADVIETPAKSRRRKKKENVDELRNASSSAAGDDAPEAQAVQHPRAATRNAGPARRRAAHPV